MLLDKGSAVHREAARAAPEEKVWPLAGSEMKIPARVQEKIR